MMVAKNIFERNVFEAVYNEVLCLETLRLEKSVT